METLVVVAQHRNNYYGGRGKGNNPAGFGSSPTRGFRDINCRAFETGSGLLPSPFKACGSPVLNRAMSSPKPQTPCGSGGGKSKDEEDSKPSRKFASSSPIPINLKDGGKKHKPSRGNMSLSELWAGPAYSNSPPPSSLPMPKFSMKPKRTVSLELPVVESDDLNLQPMAKSAPASPSREFVCSSVDFLRNDDYATKTLRRILNLDIADD